MEARNELLVKLEEIVNRDVDVNDILKIESTEYPRHYTANELA